MKYWIFKSEPGEYGIDHLSSEPNQTTCWDGIRNFQARNNLRDKVARGDRVLFYHSSCKHIGIAGTMEVSSTAYPDPAQFDKNDRYYDEKATGEDPRWFCVDVRLLEKFEVLVPTKALKADPRTATLSIFKQGRLSIAPATAAQWKAVQSIRKRLAAELT